MKRIVPVIVALVLILIIGGVGIGGMLLEKYSYSKETVDLEEYYTVTGDRLAIVLQDEIVPQQVVRRSGICYFDLDTIHAYFNEGFYVDQQEQLLLYTTAVDTYRVEIGSGSWQNNVETKDMGYAICFAEGDTIYIAADYLKLFTNYSYEVFNDLCVQVYTEWGTRELAEVTRDTQVRRLGGIKSPILRQVAEGETVEILEQMETWSEVKTSDSIIGYIENKRLSEITTETETPVTDYVPEAYTSLPMAGKVSLGFHSIGGIGGNDTLSAMVAESKGMNVIAPTWFSLNDNEGNFRSFGTTQYVQQAHGYGLQVWGVWDNFNYRNETGSDIDSYAVLSSTSKRQLLVQGMINAALSLGLDGINIDFEGLAEEVGVHYIQFLRELSVECRKNSLVLSIDNYVPFHFNEFYRLDIQGEIADYVIIMGYDEHYHGSGNPGSVASISYVSNGLTKTLEQVPAEKVVNALPFYTILWKTEGAKVTDDYVTLNNMADFLNRVNITPEWDEETCQNYAEWQSGSTTYQIWVEDLESLKVKLNVMSAQDIAGVAVWKLGNGTPAVWEMINAYAGS